MCQIHGDASHQRHTRRTYVKLTKHVAGRERHEFEISRIPGRQDNTSVLGIVLDLVDAFGQLIHALSGIIVVHGPVGGTEMAPLEAVDGSQIAHFSMPQSPTVEKVT